MSDPQSIAALGIVALTVLIFTYKICKRKKGPCGGGCACVVKPKVKQ